ncbi:nicotinamide riboside kinase 1 isoform X3 [Mugil cephalus]|uniref:nicotinamide riboside kinase 1 isoform X3 n=1 Tax=Mugil cephalus TaxID=48193 RepID=UPI001FB7C688|nr:nicotinamide riboside kinase 1 isoform X3 [Mugil cephalus]XP_047449104.1 nicotinamide riboside kinase 1 isoform X3 [Mugil cephalus]
MCLNCGRKPSGEEKPRRHRENMETSHRRVPVLSALHMDAMMSDVDSWRTDPVSFLRQRSLNPEHTTPSGDTEVYVLIVEGFLIFNYRPLNVLFDKRYFLEISYEVCKRRRSSRVYTPPDPPGYFDGHVWPMYLKNRQEMESIESEIVILNGLESREELLAAVYKDISQEMKRLRATAAI